MTMIPIQKHLQYPSLVHFPHHKHNQLLFRQSATRFCSCNRHCIPSGVNCALCMTNSRFQSLINKTCLKNIKKKIMAVAKIDKSMLSIRTQLNVPYSCKFAIVLSFCQYIFTDCDHRCNIMQHDRKKNCKRHDKRGGSAKMTCFLNDYAAWKR